MTLCACKLSPSVHHSVTSERSLLLKRLLVVSEYRSLRSKSKHDSLLQRGLRLLITPDDGLTDRAIKSLKPGVIDLLSLPVGSLTSDDFADFPRVQIVQAVPRVFRL